MADITAIILTLNEENNIGECIESIKGIAKKIVVVDSYSTDSTVEIARKKGAYVFQHEFENHAKQYMYAEKIAEIKTKWILKLDADERLTEESAAELSEMCDQNSNTDVNGINLRFLQFFMDKPLKHGGVYPWKKMCVYKKGKAFMEDRNMDEHIVLSEGRCIDLRNDSLHYGYKDLYFFVNKFNWYSSKEALEYFSYLDHEEIGLKNSNVKTWIKVKVFYKLPMGIRSWLYYIYRYYVRLGFLDGKEGKIYAFLHAYWYRFLIDAKIYEHKQLGKELHGTGALR